MQLRTRATSIGDSRDAPPPPSPSQTCPDGHSPVTPPEACERSAVVSEISVAACGANSTIVGGGGCWKVIATAATTIKMTNASTEYTTPGSRGRLERVVVM